MPYLINRLGSDWKVYDGGFGGDTTPEIMFRQGCIEAKYQNNYTLSYPNTSTNLGAVNVTLTEATTGVTGIRFGRIDNSGTEWRLFNPCTIKNGNVTYKCNATTTSITPLDETCINVPGGWISSYGATITPNVDVNVYYIGRNGGYNSTDQLVAQYQKMVDFGCSKGNGQYIVLGFHEPIGKLSTIRSVDSTYNTKMSIFGNNFLNLNYAIRKNAAELTYLVGVYSSITGINSNSNDQTFLNNGDIPRSLYIDDLYHPNLQGCDAISILIHDKMVQLHYLEDSYILSTKEKFDVVD